MRVASLDTPVPFAADLEHNFLPKKRFEEKLKELVNY
jgi:2-oxoisovalerate dehydrogenase E1 component